MAKLPTVKLINYKTGARQTVNTTEYQRDIAGYMAAGWKLYGEARGDATDDQVRNALRESDIEKQRRGDEERQRKHGDRQREADAKRVTLTTKDPVVETVEVDVPDLREATPNPQPKDGWDKMKWHERRQYVKEFTGSSTFPKNAAGAKEMMDTYLGR
jgi:hypothetical protein